MGGWASFLTIILALVSSSIANADITGTGDVSPSPPSSWNSSTTATVGNTTVGSVTAENGIAVVTNDVMIGDTAGSSGTVSITGSGTAWNSQEFDVGFNGTGQLDVTSGATSTASVGVGEGQGSLGTFNIDGGASTFSGQLYVGESGTGSLNITNGASFTSLNGFYNDTEIGSNYGGSGTVTVSGISSIWSDLSTELDIGLNGKGSVTISNGAVFSAKATNTYIGRAPTSSGTMNVTGAGTHGTATNIILGYDESPENNPAYSRLVSITNGGSFNDANATIDQGGATVDGTGSIWTNTGTLVVGNNYVGNSGETAALVVSSGSTVYSATGTLFGSLGFASINVQGVGSRWINSGSISMVGGVLNITGGGAVTSAGLSSTGTVAVSIGDGSSLNLGQSTFKNTGTTSFRATPQIAAGTYYGDPITAGSQSTFGTIQAVGGTWNSAAQTFTVTAAAKGTDGNAVGFNSNQTLRVLITGAQAQSVGASFVQGTTYGSVTATTLNSMQIQALRSTLPAGENFLSGWGFTAAGGSSTSPVYLSMHIGSGDSANGLEFWYGIGSTWVPYHPKDLSYDGSNADFSVTLFNGYQYAVTTVPEPSAVTGTIAVCFVFFGLLRSTKTTCVD